MQATLIGWTLAPEAAGSEQTADLTKTATMAELEALLAQAAEKAVRLGLDPDTFFAGVRAAYLNANPELRERLEGAQLLAQLDELRRRGMVGQA